MSTQELIFLIHQFFEEQKFTETLTCLEKDSGIYFNMKYFEEAVMRGDWDEVEKYLSKFTKLDDNSYSVKTFLGIRKQKYLEALDKNDPDKAAKVLFNELQVFAPNDEDLVKELTHLHSMNNFRIYCSNALCARLVPSWDKKLIISRIIFELLNTVTERRNMFVLIKKLIEANPLFSDKLQFPSFDSARLRRLINQSLNWQHLSCKNPNDHPNMKTLFMDHTCGEASSSQASYQPLHPAEDFVPHQAVSGGPNTAGNLQMRLFLCLLLFWLCLIKMSLNVNFYLYVTMETIQKRPRTPLTNNPTMDYQTAGSGLVQRRPRPFWLSDEVNNVPINIEEPVGYLGENHPSSSYSSDDLPHIVAGHLNERFSVRSMDFHPEQPFLLLVGTNIGEVALWEVDSQDRTTVDTFTIWDIKNCSLTLQESLANESSASVNRVIWSPQGTLFGVAYSKHIVHVYSYYGNDDLRKHLEIDAHVGSVNDIAFSCPDNQLCIITCGADMTIKVWHGIDGSKQYMFTGHEAPVYCVCPQYRDNVHFIFSTSIDGRIKAWLYDNMGARVDYDALGLYCIRMSYSDDGKRLFLSGTSRNGELHLVEWNEIEGSIKRLYNGIGRQCFDDVHFDTTNNRFLVVVDESAIIKFWDMNDVNLMMTVNVGKGLPASPCIRINKVGTLLAVSTVENGIKILVSETGLCQLEPVPVHVPLTRTSGASSSRTGTSTHASTSAQLANMPGLSIGDGRSLANLQRRFNDELGKSMISKLASINYPCQLRCLQVRDGPLKLKMIRLTYTNSGGAILALADNGMHLLWKWNRNEQNMTGKATTNSRPRLWEPGVRISMRNNTTEANPQNAVPCFALTSNDSYIVSASGGIVSVFNLRTFKTMATLGIPPPAATSLAFFPGDNNIIVIGFEDASIHIYNVRLDEVKAKLIGHEKRVTGLAFSNVLNVLVSSGADAQICVWNLDLWVKKAAKFLEIPRGRVQSPLGKTSIQFHRDEIHLLVTHQTQISVYNVSVLDFVIQWNPENTLGSITDATFSCNHKLIYVSFEDGSLCVLTSMLQPRCWIRPAAYLTYNPRVKVYPLTLAAHPSEPNQLALGLNDGGLHIIEPLISEGQWGNVRPPRNAPGSSSSNPMEVD
ncbi:hypothetical protein LguiB_023143 [Lonicera macranthoides]